MYVSLNIVRYPKRYIPLAFLSMALFRIPLFFSKNIKFWKLLGCGKNGTFDITPDLQQWGLMCVWENKEALDTFQQKSIIWRFWKRFTSEQWTFIGIPIEAHGAWDKRMPFQTEKSKNYHEGAIAVLTRASIRLSKLHRFWKNVPIAAAQLDHAEGFIFSVGIGETPFINQATFSIWENQEMIKKYAYQQKAHAEIIKKTRKEKWYSEELFARFIPIKTEGTVRGINPLPIS